MSHQSNLHHETPGLNSTPNEVTSLRVKACVWLRVSLSLCTVDNVKVLCNADPDA